MQRKGSHYLISALTIIFCLTGGNAMAQNNTSTTLNSASRQEIQKNLHRSKSAQQRVAANQHRRNHSFTDFGQAYTDFKNWLNKEYNFDYSVDVSYMAQRATPSGKKTSYQTIIYPSITWTPFQNEYGTGTVNLGYNIVRYGGISAEHLGNNIGAATGINDYTSPQNSFDEFYFTYQLPGKWNWLTLAAGQFPMYNFDGSAYVSNQQVNFINESLSQNGSSTYPTASMGAYVQIAPNDEWTLAFGGQDATNIDGQSLKTHFGEEHYTTFASLSYTPTIKNLGAGQYSVLFYNQPWVDQQKETTNGWSLNFSQNLGDKWAVFARVNGVSGNQATIDQSWVLGTVYNNPLDRNPLDQIGLAVAYNKINEKAVGSKLNHDAETVLEAYWAWGLSKWMTITPDIQYYINPAENPKSDNAAVFSLRTTFFF